MEILKILLVGGDASVWIGLSSTLGESLSQIFVPKETDDASLAAAGAEVSVVIAVITGDHEDRFEHLHALARAGLARRTIVLADTGDAQAPLQAVLIGCAGYIEKGSTPEHLASAVAKVASHGVVYDAPAAAELTSRLELRHPGQGPNIAAARALASALELKDTYTGGHAERVAALAMRLARAAKLEDALPSESLEAAFLLHDVGKIGIPESILNKTAGLTDTERRVLQTHPILGEKIVAPLGFPACVRQVIRHHHERWDGTGYPDGLDAEEIPAPARVFAIADALDAMTSVRPYRKPISFHNAIREIVLHAGTQFDPALTALAEEVYLGEQLEVTSGDLR